MVIIGGLNWGLIGLFDWNLVAAIFGGVPVIERIIYVLVGLSALLTTTMPVMRSTIDALKKADVVIDRHVLSEIAMKHPAIFEKIVSTVKK